MVEWPCPSRLGTGVEVEGGATSREQQRIVLARWLVSWTVGRSLEDGATSWGHRSVLLLADRAAGHQVVTVGLTLIGVGGEDAVGVEAVGTLRVAGVDRPRDTSGAAQLVVGQTRVVDRA